MRDAKELAWKSICNDCERAVSHCLWQPDPCGLRSPVAREVSVLAFPSRTFSSTPFDLGTLAPVE